MSSAPFVDTSSGLSNFFGSATAEATYIHLFLGISITVWLLAFVLFPGCFCCLPVVVFGRCCKSCAAAEEESSHVAHHGFDGIDHVESVDLNDVSIKLGGQSGSTGSLHQCTCCCLHPRSFVLSCAALLSAVCAPLFAFFLSAFSLAPWGAMGLVAFVLWSSTATVWTMRSQKINWRDFFFTVRSAPINTRVCIVIVLFILAFVSWFVAFVVADVCIALHPAQFSTRFTRMLDGPSCLPGSPCLVYLTGAADMSTQAIVNFHLNSEGKSVRSAFVEYWIFNASASVSGSAMKSEAQCFAVEFITEESRFVCWSDLSNLQPDTLYSFVTVYTLTPSPSIFLISSVQNFRTSPALNASSNFSFVVGGDYESSSDKLKLGPQLSRAASARFSTSATSSQLSRSRLRFGLIAGDVCYANAMPTCYRRWDSWIREWNANMRITEAVVDVSSSNQTLISLLVPILAAIGNHESGGMFGQKMELIPFYSRYLPQQHGLQGVNPARRPMYHAHWLGNHSVLLVLDSGVTEGNDVDNLRSDQARFIHATLQAAVARCVCNRFVAYHYALYPSKQNPWDADFVNTIRAAWGPIFDAYNVTLAFEHHYHLFKITPQIRANRIVASALTNRTRVGVTYLGDGNWGIQDNFNNAKPDAWYIEHASPAQHVYVVTARAGLVSVQAIAPDRSVLLEFERETSAGACCGS